MTSRASGAGLGTSHDVLERLGTEQVDCLAYFGLGDFIAVTNQISVESWQIDTASRLFGRGHWNGDLAGRNQHTLDTESHFCFSVRTRQELSRVIR